MAPVTIRDVAEYAGVSRATVSRVLNNRATVAEALRTRVLEAVEVLGYQPNRAARALRANTSDVIGLLISDIENPFFISVVRGVEDAAYARKMSVVLCNTDEDSAKQQMYLRLMQAERAAGLIVSPTHVDDGEPFVRLSQSGIPVVLLDRRVENCDLDAVAVDNVQGAYSAVKHLIDLGYQRIGLVGGSMHLTTGRDRYQGYRNALEAAGMSVDRALMKFGDFKADSGYRLTREFLALSNPPRALFVANNLMTLGALRALREAGIRVPEDMALVGFDDVLWATELSPALTTVSQPTYELGQEAVRLLLYRIAEPDAPYRTVTLQTRLTVRESCGAAAPLNNRRTV